MFCTFCSSIIAVNACSRHHLTSGMSFLPKLPELFHSPPLSLYRHSTVARSIRTLRPSTVASFSHSAHETCPARNFFNGLLIFFTSANCSDGGSLGTGRTDVGIARE